MVDRLWPRGISKEEINHDKWGKEIAPSKELRKYFNHEKRNRKEFQKAYRHELDQKIEVLEQMIGNIENKKLLLLHGARDRRINNAIVSKNFIVKNFPGITLE